MENYQHDNSYQQPNYSNQVNGYIYNSQLERHNQFKDLYNHPSYLNETNHINYNENYFNDNYPEKTDFFDNFKPSSSDSLSNIQHNNWVDNDRISNGSFGNSTWDFPVSCNNIKSPWTFDPNIDKIDVSKNSNISSIDNLEHSIGNLSIQSHVNSSKESWALIVGRNKRVNNSIPHNPIKPRNLFSKKPTENVPLINMNPSHAKFFVIKSYSEDDVYRSIKYGVWCSTEMGNHRLNNAYVESQAKYPIYLFFSVNGSGHFCGLAQMVSAVDYSTCSSIWSQCKWKGQFHVRWIYVKDVPNSQLRHIRVETNDNKPVTNSRDVTQVPLEKGKQVLQIISGYRATSSIHDDFSHYEQRELSESMSNNR